MIKAEEEKRKRLQSKRWTESSRRRPAARSNSLTTQTIASLSSISWSQLKSAWSVSTVDLHRTLTCLIPYSKFFIQVWTQFFLELIRIPLTSWCISYINGADTREAYIDEVHTAVGLPLFLEGPEDPSTFNGWSVNIQGIPRYLCNQGGILRYRRCFTLNPTYFKPYTNTCGHAFISKFAYHGLKKYNLRMSKFP